MIRKTDLRDLLLLSILLAILDPRICEAASKQTSASGSAEDVCGDGSIQCGNGRCVKETKICDGVNDCHDDMVTDENNSTCPGLPMTCGGGKKRCPTTNICISAKDMCDGYDDCGDGADEVTSYCRQEPCAPLQVQCPSGRCIPKTWQCDDANDCGDGWDEGAQCNQTASTCLGRNVYRCDDGKCISRVFICDGENDCSDGSDEKRELDCGNRICRDNEYKCLSSEKLHRHLCIPRTWLCDGEVDCPSGDDENATFCESHLSQCNPGEFRCQNGRCIHASWVCDQDNDCQDGSDEHANCTYAPCATDMFACNSTGCIPSAWRCDGSKDCRDESDELDCDNGEPEKKEIVTNKPVAGKWKCNSTGEYIDSAEVCDAKVDCVDGSDEGSRCEIDECRWGPYPCSQGCENTAVSFKCRCNTTYYKLEMDGSTCTRLKNDPEPWIILANRHYIRRLTMDGNNSVLARGLERVNFLDYDLLEEMVYFADSENQLLYRMRFAEANPDADPRTETILKLNLEGIEGIAVDWIGRKLYFHNQHDRTLRVCELNGTSCRVLLRDRYTHPRSMALYPHKGYLFFTDWSLTPFIGRIGMDGSEFTKIAEDKLGWPNAITVDYFSEKVFFADARLDQIGHFNLDGSDRRRLLVQNTPHVFSVSVFDDFIYWSDWNLKKVFKAHKFTGQGEISIANTVQLPNDLHVVHPLRQMNGTNPCGKNNGGCTHLCLISPGGTSFKCECPDDFLLVDEQTCIANCSMDQFQCGTFPNGKNATLTSERARDDRCIPIDLRCDNSPDCADGSDESGCPSVAACGEGDFQCADSGCIPRILICNGHDECRDKSDESDCDQLE